MKHALLLLSLIATQAQAQIIYTDVDPDTTITQSSPLGSTDHALDINNDGLTDVILTASRAYTNKSVYLGTSNGSNVLMCCPILLAKAIPNNEFISSVVPIALNSSWFNAQNAILRQIPTTGGGGGGGGWGGGGNPIPFGDWSTTADRFFAIRIAVGGDWYYGWVRVSVAPVGAGISFTVRDYAYNSVPNDGILAGDTASISTGITSTALQGMQVSPNPFSSVLTIALPTGTTGAVGCRVLSLQGQAVITRTVAATPGQSPGQASGPSAITLDLGSLAPGTYLLEMLVDGERIVRKVVKE